MPVMEFRQDAVWPMNPTEWLLQILVLPKMIITIPEEAVLHQLPLGSTHRLLIEEL
jgi:hypothetical protein